MLLACSVNTPIDNNRSHCVACCVLRPVWIRPHDLKKILGARGWAPRIRWWLCTESHLSFGLVSSKMSLLFSFQEWVVHRTRVVRDRANPTLLIQNEQLHPTHPTAQQGAPLCSEPPAAQPPTPAAIPRPNQAPHHQQQVYTKRTPLSHGASRLIRKSTNLLNFN